LLSRYEEQGETTLFVEIARTTHHHRHGQVYAAQLTVQIPKKLVRAEETHEDIRVAIDKARDTMKKELARIKGKEVTLRKKKR
jgi:ribosomal subunit interface protein